jgi:hypothetical protein
MSTGRNILETLVWKSLGKRLPDRPRVKTGNEASGSTKRGFLSLLKEKLHSGVI